MNNQQKTGTIKLHTWRDFAKVMKVMGAFKCCFLGVMSVVSFSAFALFEEFAGIKWYYHTVSSDNNCKVYLDQPSQNTGVIIIPHELGGKPVAYMYSTLKGRSGLTGGASIPDGVISLGYYAFSDCSGLNNITIPPSVTSIGDYTFSGCSKLTSITIPDSVTSIGANAFRGCSGLRSVRLSLGVTCIREYAFSWCSGLRNVIIPNTVKDIGDYAFLYCSGLTDVTIPEQVMSIGNNAFQYCRELKSVMMSDSVTSIGNSAFADCNKLTNMVISSCVTNIGDAVFSGCTALTNVTIPYGVKSIGNNAFSGCKGITNMTIPDSVTSIGENAFYGCNGLTSVTIPNSVTSIGDNAFYGCSGLTSVTIPNSVTSIGGNAFYGCSGLTSVTIPNNVTSIGENAFYGCSSLTSVTIPNRVKTIGRSAFHGCSCLTRITIPDNVMDIGVDAFYDTHFYNEQPDGLVVLGKIAYKMKGVCPAIVTIPDGVTSIGYGAFRNCSGLTEVRIPSSVTNIGDYAFSSCSRLTDVTTSTNIMCIGVSAFYNTPFYDNCPDGLVVFGNVAYKMKGRCPAFVTIPDGVTSITAYAFSGCNELTSVTIPESVTSVGENAFSGCSELVSVTIPNSVTSIGAKAFYGCSSLTAVTIPDGIINIGDHAFYNCNGLMEVAIPQYLCTNELASVFPSAYQTITNVIISDTVTNVGNYVFKDCLALSRILIPNNVLNIGDGVLYGCSNLTSLTISDCVTNIPDYAFYNCSKLTHMALPDNVTRIGRYAFYNCNKLTHMAFPNNVTDIGDSAFSSCRELASITLPDSVISIGGEAFWGCSALSSVRIPRGMTNIGDYTFQGCSCLSSVTIPESVITIGVGAFNYSGLTSVTIPDSVTNIGDYAFEGCSGLVNVVIPDSVISIGYNAFFDTPFYSRQPDGLVVFGKVAYKMKGQCPAIVTIPDGVTSIGEEAFLCCKDLKGVTIPTSVKNIGREAFYNCDRLTHVSIPDDVTHIGSSAFTRCQLLKSVMIPQCACTNVLSVVFPSTYQYITNVVIANNATAIGARLFSGCSRITDVTIPNNVARIGSNAFSNCSNLTNIMFDGNAPEIGDSAFSEVASNCCAHIHRISTGWASAIPGEWHGIAIDYIDQIVKFDANGGEGGTSNVLERGTAIVAPEVERTGYTFNGWSPDVDATVPSHDVSYTAQWTTNKYIVTFNANGGVGGWSRTLDYNSPIVAPTVSRTGHTFKGWSPSVAATVPLDGVTYTAQWEVNQYTVTFNANGGVGGTSGKQDYGTAIVAPAVIRTGYTFKGWSPSVASVVPARDVTYTAQWEINKYTVSFDANGGTCGMESTVVEYGTTVGQLPIPTRTNATFVGWFTDAEGGSRVADSTVINTAMALHAHWLLLGEALEVDEDVVVVTREDVPWMPILDSAAKVGGTTTRSGAIGDRTNTWLSATVSGAGTMSFWCKVSCEHDDDNTFTWDRLMVYTNDVEVVDWRMDGETDWTRREVSFVGGENTVKWVYFKDRSISEGEDCAWVDGVTWTLADVAVDVGGGKSVLVPMDWIDAHSNIVTAVGGDKSAAMKSTAANGRKVWECYVLGLDPEKANDFKITSFPLKSDGTPDLSAITFEPEQNQWNLSGATPKLKGKATLDAEWQDVPPGGNPSFRFFTVEVQMP